MLQRLLEKIKENNLDVDIEMIKKAYNVAEKAHEGQLRESGDPYILHPVEVAIILVEMGLDTDAICAALLHDVVEDTHLSYEDVKREFNESIADLVDGVTKLGKIEYKSKEEQQAENIRKVLIAMAKDIRVILIKLADRLHNMRTLKYLPPEKQKAKAEETLDIYAPLAHRLGISKIKWELEDLSLRYLHPDEYYELVSKVQKKRAEREKEINEIKNMLQEKLEQAGIKADIDGRPKHFYSIYRKMHYKNKTFDQIFDLLAVRVIVDTVKDCYAALGIVHTLWKPIPGRFKDYIAMPKPNMYQSLHSTVIGPNGQPFEIQIRTWEMHRTAEYGIAAHWKYKEGINNKELDIDEKLHWLRQILELQKEAKDATEFMETVKIDLFSDEVFVFTPKGAVIDLPVDSTPIDFAYRIHTDVGNKCVGAKVNGRMVPLDYKLKTGDIVEIITSANSKGPSRDWLNIAKSSQAKNKIRQWFKRTFKEENIEKGREIFEKEIKRQGLNLNEVLKTEYIEPVIRKFNFSNIEDLYSAIGSGALTAHQVISKLKEEIKKEEVLPQKEIITEDKAEKKPRKGEIKKPGVIIEGEKDLFVRFAKCCNPVPGDEIIGFITRGRGVSIHRKDCSNFKHLAEAEPDRVIDASWTGEHNAKFLAEISIEANDRHGLIADISTTLTNSKLSVKAINARTTRNHLALINLTIEVTSVEQIEKLIKDLRKLNGIIDVYRNLS
ncbi:bifunctional (p)ppGpp synthetase/guanosine-3',5'-bis(diphosphate) 3'-pyrophosphohydrolase [Caloramator sp. CAR-1]|uniref:RelA/SpoT family protein n=1 Tax=Caloramator sp. CAR-1 TaxID=3062777 RepID=UPI0026E3EC5E|nr:bifunctional (p)ppGpp synthetase/guanosine-3',5'-bis(diphosphate) 3'-pyrophosphohydrolase [Caloramator sp. CAR-1]MDO6354297.1 bifunctional (p)ppGpp synthetase/guanosine-3',5'-bis(diphosphate) 3'-pyrophosphohydrolase [Caloramator sp. CAR-1]